MAKKISEISYIITPEQIENQWQNVKSERIKLLRSSDWTQLSDSPLDLNTRKLWANFRKKIRNIDRFSYDSPDEAMIELDQLREQLITQNIIDTVSDDFINSQKIIERVIEKTTNSNIILDSDTLDITKSKLKRFLSIKVSKINEVTLFDVYDLFLIMEKCSEALDLLTEEDPNESIKIKSYPLIIKEVTASGKEPIEIAKQFIQQKKDLIKTIEKYKNDLLLIENDLDKIKSKETLSDLIKENNQYYM